MTKQSTTQAAQPPVDLSLTPDNLRKWLLNDSIHQQKALAEVKRRMQDAGVSDKLIASSLHYEPTIWDDHVKETLSW